MSGHESNDLSLLNVFTLPSKIYTNDKLPRRCPPSVISITSYLIFDNKEGQW